MPGCAAMDVWEVIDAAPMVGRIVEMLELASMAALIYAAGPMSMAARAAA